MTLNFLARKARILLVIYLSIWAVVDYILPKQIFRNNIGLLDIVNSDKHILTCINKHYFWITWLGNITCLNSSLHQEDFF